MNLHTWIFTIICTILAICDGQEFKQAVELTNANHDHILGSAQVVFVAFCADWCPFSRRLKPVFEESAETFHRENPTASAIWAIVDSQRQADIGEKYFVNKYPTMKVFVNGELISKEYRSTRSVEALTTFVKFQLSTAINEYSSQDQLDQEMDKSKRNVIAMLKKDGSEFANLKKIASILREDCSFWVPTDHFGTQITENKLTFIDPDTNEEAKFTGNFNDYEFLKQWVTDKCIPLVREVTFENVEELTEEGNPFLIYFRDPANKSTDKIFSEAVARELYDQRSAINPLLADGLKFAHPLKHLGRTRQDLPVLAIDSFQHMYLFPNMQEMNIPGKLRQFVQDLHSGKLHKEFHENMDARLMQLAKDKHERGLDRPDGVDPREKVDTTPPPSVFKELKPSDKRYSILQKSEL